MWVKLSDRMPHDPDIDRLSHGAFRLLIACWCYCSEHLTDGFVPDDRIPRFMPGFKPSFLAELCRVPSGRTEPLLARTSGGYLVRNWSKYNHSREWWDDKRAKDAARLAEWRAGKGK